MFKTISYANEQPCGILTADRPFQQINHKIKGWSIDNQ